MLKHKSQASETFKNFHVWIVNETQSSITLFLLIMEENILVMNMKPIFIRVDSNIKPLPQHNGVAKRIKMTLSNMVHLMLLFKDVNVQFM
jgi:hypothetical protein